MRSQSALAEARVPMLKSVVQNLAFNVLLAALLFVPAGTLAWPQAWIFLILLDACSLATGYWLLKTDPALLAERMKSPFSVDQRPHDRVVIGARYSLRNRGWSWRARP